MILSRYIKIFPCPELPGQVLLFSCRTGAVVRVAETTVAAARAGTLSAAAAETLERYGFLVADTERDEMHGWFERINARRRRFGAVVVLTRACNLACPYCFEGGLDGGGAMTPETADLLVAMIEREYFSKGWRVDLDFYGGEPLLRPDLIRRIAAPLCEKAVARGITFSCDLVTNGTLLTRPLATELAGLGLRSAKVTLDGPPDIHDRYRPYTSGAGSFATILHNMKEVCDVVSITVGGNYTCENWREFPRLLDILMAEGITPDRTGAVRFDPVVGRQGGAGLPDFAEGCTAFTEPWLAEATLSLREEIMKRGYRTSKPEPFSCMIELKADLAIDADGTCYRCPAFIGHPGFGVGDLRSGVGEIPAAYGMYHWKCDECLDCTYLPLCFGGCRYVKFVETGVVGGVECHRAFLDATLEEMVRQGLRYGSAEQGVDGVKVENRLRQ